MKTFKYTALSLIFVGALVAGAYFAGVATFPTFASAPSGLPATQVTADTIEIGPDVAVELFGSRRACTSRVIRTQGVVANLTLADTDSDVASTSLSAVVGFTQAASTTVAYDGGLYGCGRVFGSATASTTITTADFN